MNVWGNRTENGTEKQLLDEIRRLGPWHQNIQLTERLSIGTAFGADSLSPTENAGVSLIDGRQSFLSRLDRFYPHGFRGKTLLDCACNAGAHCFWAKERGAASAVGFDVRSHWIDQANFVLAHRTVAPTDGIKFAVCDLMELPPELARPVDLTIFKGIFYHLADPIRGLQIASELTREILWFNSAMRTEGDQEAMYCMFESTRNVMSGVHSLCWLPGGPMVIGKLLHWLGFVDIRICHIHKPAQRRNSRLDMVAAKKPGLLSGFDDLPESARIHQEDFGHY